jgi:hypothetical protein
MKPLPLVLLAVAIAAGSCKKEEINALPKATQTGQNTFGCLVDGKAFGPLPPQGINFSKREPLEGSVYRTDLLVSANGNGYVDFALRNAFRPGTYPLGETRTGSYGNYEISAGSYYTTTDHKGSVTLTRIDTVAKVAAGTFQFTGVNRSGQTVSVTEGRFDVRLK